MIIQPSTLDAINYGFNTRFTEGYTKAVTFYERLCTDMPSLGRENRYAWLDRLPRMREWVGEKIFNNLAAREFTVVNKDYEDSIEVDRNQIKDDQIGVYGPALEMLGLEAKILPDRLTADLMANGDSALCFDGQDYFNTSHPTDMDNPSKYPVQSNLLAATPLTQANYALARATMRAFKGKDNTPLGITPDLLVCGTDLEEQAREIATAETVPGTIAIGGGSNGAASKTNVYKGSFDVVSTPWLTATGVWYLFATGMPIKPFVHQTREAAILIPMINPTDPNVYNRRKYQWSVESREAVGYGLWFLGTKCLPS